MPLKKLDCKFFRQDSLIVARELVGCVLISKKYGHLVSVKIVETEAYPGTDAASHAYLGKVTTRNKIQYSSGGVLYLYLVMGLHVMTSIVTNQSGVSDVVFLRAGEPLDGLPLMKRRRSINSKDSCGVTDGPGKLTQALGLTLADNGQSVCGSSAKIWLLKDSSRKFVVSTAARINLGLSKVPSGQAKKSLKRPWRFFLKGSPFLSC